MVFHVRPKLHEHDSVKTFDDFAEANPAGPPIETTDKPEVGELIDGKRALRVKAIGAIQLTALALTGESCEARLKFKQHKTRPFVFWLVEIEP